MRILFLALLLLSASAFAAKEKPSVSLPSRESPAVPADLEKANTELTNLLEKSRVQSKDNFREDLKLSQNGEDIPVEKIPPAPAADE